MTDDHLDPFCVCSHDRGHHASEAPAWCGAWAGPGCCPCAEYTPRTEAVSGVSL